MPSKYAVLQFSPDPLAEEKLNFGVVAWNERGAEVRFVTAWDRLRRFAGGRLSLVREFATDFETNVAGRPDGASSAAEIERMVRDWNHEIQFTEPRGSIEEPSELLERMARRYLPIASGPTKARRTRRTAVAAAHRVLREAVERQLPERVDEFVHLKERIEGELQEHQFDVVLANGKAIAALDGLSFDVGTSSTLQRDVDAIAWALDDVRKKSPRLPLAVYAVRPTSAEARAVFKTAQQIYEGLEAKLIVTSAELKDWSTEQVALINRKPSTTKARSLEQV